VCESNTNKDVAFLGERNWILSEIGFGALDRLHPKDGKSSCAAVAEFGTYVGFGASASAAAASSTVPRSVQRKFVHTRMNTRA